MPATIEQLPATPLAILEDRSLFVPQEPADPEAVMRFWEQISRETGGERRLVSSVESTLHLRTREHERAGDLDLEEVLGFDALEWFIHQQAPEIASDEYINRYSKGCIANSFWDALINKKIADRIASGSDDIVAPVLVIPQDLDGLLSEINSWVRHSKVRVNSTIIGNVKDNFAERVEPNMAVKLFGNARNFTAAYAGRVYGEKGKPRVTVHGDVAQAAGHCANSLVLHITGDAEGELGIHAGGFRSPTESVLIRVDGNGGERIGEDAHGAFQISCGSFESVGKTKGANPDSHIEVGPNPPGKGNQIIPTVDSLLEQERYRTGRL